MKMEPMKKEGAMMKGRTKKTKKQNDKMEQRSMTMEPTK